MGACPYSLAVGPMLLGRNPDPPLAREPSVLCSHMAFLCFCLGLKTWDCDGVVLVVDVEIHWEVLLVAVTGERATTIPRCQPFCKHHTH